MQVRRYGSSGPAVIVLHGGPGAPGYLAPLADALSGAFRVAEPFQRGSGAVPLTVARHVADLHALIRSSCADSRPTLLGHSWGAMLALAYAAAHPGRTAALVLVGCGTFDEASRMRLQATCAARTSATLRERLDRLADDHSDPDVRLAALGRLTFPIYSSDPIGAPELAHCDARAHHESWQDMLRRQECGDFPAAFEAVEAPVLMLHGADDPHPGRMIHDDLARFVARLEYREWRACGHYPWLERAARDEFFAVTIEWIARHARGD